MAKKVKIKSKKPQGIGSKIFDVVNYLLLAILGFIMFYPMFYVFIVSISSSQYINQGLVTCSPEESISMPIRQYLRTRESGADIRTPFYTQVWEH